MIGTVKPAAALKLLIELCITRHHAGRINLHRNHAGFGHRRVELKHSLCPRHLCPIGGEPQMRHAEQDADMACLKPIVAVRRIGELKGRRAAACRRKGQYHGPCRACPPDRWKYRTHRPPCR